MMNLYMQPLLLEGGIFFVLVQVINVYRWQVTREQPCELRDKVHLSIKLMS